jgi:hypothetical protein
MSFFKWFYILLAAGGIAAPGGGVAWRFYRLDRG